MAESLSDVGGDFDAGEETRHRQNSFALRTARLRARGDQLFCLRQDARHDRVDTRGVRVQAIVLVQLGIVGHPVEEERIKDDRMSRGKRRIDGVEGFA